MGLRIWAAIAPLICFWIPLPYNAHATACDALWAGLPLITCQGSSFSGRVAASLLQAAGLPELVTGSLGDYEAPRDSREPALLQLFRR